ncbi:hypothetical protein SAMN05216304_11667 [Bosea sp. OK403]|nr:hypothetical protein SAMN05216304_11667 [Bosea sp. OK403]
MSIPFSQQKRAVIPGAAKRRPGIHSGTAQEWIPDQRGLRRLSGMTARISNNESPALKASPLTLA